MCDDSYAVRSAYGHQVPGQGVSRSICRPQRSSVSERGGWLPDGKDLWQVLPWALLASALGELLGFVGVPAWITLTGVAVVLTADYVYDRTKRG